MGIVSQSIIEYTTHNQSDYVCIQFRVNPSIIAVLGIDVEFKCIYAVYDAKLAYSLLKALPITILLTSEVPAPISYNFALRIISIMNFGP